MGLSGSTRRRKENRDIHKTVRVKGVTTLLRGLRPCKGVAGGTCLVGGLVGVDSSEAGEERLG